MRNKRSNLQKRTSEKRHVMHRAILLMGWGLVFLLANLALATVPSQTGDQGITVVSALNHPTAQESREISRPVPTQVQVKMPPPTWLELGSQAIILIIGISGILLFFFRDKMETYKSLKMMAFTVNTFMSGYMSDVLKGFEKQDIVEEGKSDDWLKATSAYRYASPQSIKKLNSDGMKVLKKSGIQQIIDSNLEPLIKELNQKKPESALDVENQAYLTLKDKAIKDWSVPIKNYVYTHSAISASDVIFIGSIYLRDKYLGAHTELQVEEVGNSKYIDALLQKIKKI